ncbi:hypothetical protein ILYODFUR_027467 [Ilyodon furcidens]|uniref:Uncharacterized protein n=1 Tax=Ilyodon furcidens TaxID=33524 RepID=A0ABV0TBI3_9TELE
MTNEGNWSFISSTLSEPGRKTRSNQQTMPDQNRELPDVHRNEDNDEEFGPPANFTIIISTHLFSHYFLSSLYHSFTLLFFYVKIYCFHIRIYIMGTLCAQDKQEKT